MNKTKKIILSGLLLALLLILGRSLSIKTPILVISFSFIPIMMSGVLLGPKYSLMIAALGDLIGALLFPFGTYFVGFTIIQAIVGLVYGLTLYNKKENEFYTGKKLIIRLIISSIIVLGIIELPLMSLMLNLLYGNAFLVILTSRLLVKAVMFPIQIVCIYFLSIACVPLYQKYLSDSESNEQEQV